MKQIPDNFIILEMANNHMGDLAHGINLIRSFVDLSKKYPMFKFAFKLQYRDLNTFIHPNFKNRLDNKYIKRFLETSLSKDQFNQLVSEIKKNGFTAMATCFDEASFDLFEDQNLDIIKIASCSLTDWSLLERAVLIDKPIIASTAGASSEEIDQVVFFLKNRKKSFALMHCVGEYPTPYENAHLSQIDFLKKRYEDVRIGFSTHENPDNIDLIKIAIAKGANIFEKHVGLNTKDYSINAYSATPEQLDKWLAAAVYALKVCGEDKNRSPENKLEKKSLQELKRGMYAKNLIKTGDIITRESIYFAFPPNDTQYTANDFSKFSEFTATTDIEINNQVGPDNTIKKNTRKKYLAIAEKVKNLLLNAKINPPKSTGLEISHHYGIDNFEKFGLVMITVINREYCKKLLMILPGQKHPEQYHEKKEETFHMLYGDLKLELNGKSKILKAGDIITILPGIKHSFESNNGAVVEEISTNHSKDDSYYTDSLISKNLNRKTFLNYWIDI
jgi:sialic acid synthase SpsE/mannose-6-phosphate isomerase-like protein (cupin superfamily)